MEADRHFSCATILADPRRHYRARLTALAAEFGTPLYVYDAAVIRARAARLQKGLAPLKAQLHFSVKANSNLSILRLMRQLGFGFDVVSGGELARLQAANLPLSEVSFAGVGKTGPEIRRALAANIGCFTVESAGELARIAALATETGRVARVILRLNPNVDPHTHKFITTGRAETKFGLDFETAARLWQQFDGQPAVRIAGVHLHIGSQVQQIAPYVEAAQKALAFIAARRAEGRVVSTLDLGGGFGIGYQGEADFSPSDLATALSPLLQNTGLQLVFEPGRWLIAPAGILLMTAQYIKPAGRKTFVVVDAGMQTMIRPALYGGRHRIDSLTAPSNPDAPPIVGDVVGPVCESSDFLAQNRELPPVSPGDVLALFDAGAYGMVMASNYNSHCRPAEVLLDGSRQRLIRRRETMDDLLATERDLPD